MDQPALNNEQCGSAIIPYLQDSRATYTVLAVLVIAHLLLNYLGVRGVVLRSFNRQRCSILWSAYRGARHAEESKRSPRVLTPTEVAAQEYLFAAPSALLHPSPAGTRRVSGHCVLGAPLSTILVHSDGSTHSRTTLDARTFSALLAIHSSERYTLWLRAASQSPPEIVAVLQDGHGPLDHLRAWLHAAELAALLHNRPPPRHADDVLRMIQQAKDVVQEWFTPFMDAARSEGWDVEAAGGGLITGSPRTIRVAEEDSKTK